MITKQVRASRLTTRHEIVRGGDGRRRTAHELCEVNKSLDLVEVVLAGTWERVTYEPGQLVLVKNQQQ
jgi:hypothetical protein